MNTKKIVIIIISSLLATAFCPRAGATTVVVDANFPYATTWLEYSPNTYFEAQSFKPTKRYLYAVEAYLNPNTNATGLWGVEIWANNPAADVNSDPRIGTLPLGVATVTHIVTGAQPNCWVRWAFAPPIDLNSYINQSGSVLIYWTNAYADLEHSVAMTGALYSAEAGLDYPDGARYFRDYIHSGGAWRRADHEWSSEYEEYFTWDMQFRTFGADALPSACGDEGTVKPVGDLNGDCYVNFKDMEALAGSWLECTDPSKAECDQYWY